MAATSVAQQISFVPKSKYGKTEYKYHWQDMQGRLQTVRFRLSDYDIGQAQRQSQPLSSAQVRNRVIDKLTPMLTIYGSRGIQVHLIPQGDQIRFSVRGRTNAESKAVMKKVQKQYDKFYKESLKELGYKVEKEAGRYVVMSDYQNIAKKQYDEFRPVARALSSKASGSKRQKFNYVLNFLQSIPYATPHRNASGYDMQFSSPVSLIENNRGDCDEKSLAFGAVLRRMSGATPVYMVLIEGHALVAVGVRPNKEDLYIKKNGRKLVLAEPTGPGLMPLGRIAERSKREINAGRYKLIKMPNLY